MQKYFVFLPLSFSLLVFVYIFTFVGLFRFIFIIVCIISWFRFSVLSLNVWFLLQLVLLLWVVVIFSGLGIRLFIFLFFSFLVLFAIYFFSIDFSVVVVLVFVASAFSFPRRACFPFTARAHSLYVRLNKLLKVYYVLLLSLVFYCFPLFTVFFTASTVVFLQIYFYQPILIRYWLKWLSTCSFQWQQSIFFILFPPYSIAIPLTNNK